MNAFVDAKLAVVVPNWNGKADLPACLNSLLKQTQDCEIVVVENGSTDGSLELLAESFPTVTVLPQPVNLGFAGGVNAGIRYAIQKGYDYVALFNNDAIADADWLRNLWQGMADESTGITTCTLASADGQHLDSTGEEYSVWGLPYPRGRGEAIKGQYDGQPAIFAASGGASLYRVAMLNEIGLFDEDFFAYYEDVDISFRTQLAGWKVRYVPAAIAYHDAGTTSSKIKGFVTYQTMKNLPVLLMKNVPRKYLFRIGWRFFLAHTLFFLRAVSRGQGWTALKGDAVGTRLLFKNLPVRRAIQKSRKVPDEYIWGMLVHDLPPNATSLRSLRNRWQRLIFWHR
ncbi:MAG: glycosyltransferase family 2 protein [Candidatus Saccharibacteria bacterium]|nr:glycosyltransferase family 2 protein [Candidatus Saccharibacteria bacterium]